jgi:glycosyltransferase involved in cell wall biosynthesis
MDFPQARLVIAGEGPLQEELKGLADDLKITENIDWIGRIEDPLNLIAQMDIFVMTSLYEGFGLVVLEAISQEVPVIASGNETFMEIFDAHQECLFPVGNYESLALRIRKYLSQDECSRLAETQQRILKHYSPARMIAGMEKVYTAVQT